MPVTSEQVSEDLGSVLGDVPTQEVVEECIKICNTYAISPEDLAFKWQALVINRTHSAAGSSVRRLDMGGVVELRDSIQLDISKNPKQEQVRHQQSTRHGAPLQIRQKPRQAVQSRAGSGAGIRQSTGTSTSRGALHGGGAASGASSLSFPIKILDNLEDRNYRYMYERIAERSTVLDDRIDEFAEIIREHYLLEDIQGPTETSEEEAVIVGRICADVETEQAEGKLHEGVLYLETSRMIDAGTRGLIKFNPNVNIRGARPGTSSVGLFPGAIAAFKGQNATGDWFQVSEVLSLPRLSSRNTGLPKQSWTMAVAAGPYTLDSDLEYTPFLTLLQELQSSPPTYVLLLGPFIDQRHPRIENGDIEVALSDLFKQKILSPLRQLLNEAPNLRIVIVPNPRDLIYDHAVFPQRSYGSFGLERTITVPNPSTFILDGVQFSACSVDVLLHLRKTEFQKRTEPTPGDAESVESARNSLANAFRHILDQRSLYPLFPTPKAYSADVNLDVSHSELLKLEAAPDVLVLPSILGKFHKVIDSTVCLNPSYVSKGSYMTLHVPDRNATSSIGVDPSRPLPELVTVRQHTLTI